MSMQEFLEEYNIQLDALRQELLQDTTHPMLIEGKAGSGKTFLFLARNAYLIKSELAQSDEILNLVYDAQAARRMAKDYRYRYCDDDIMPSFVDIHSFAYRIIRFYDKRIGKESFKAYRDMEKVIRKLVKDMFALELTTQELQRLQRKISYCKNMMLPEREIAKIEVAGMDFLAFLKAYDKFKEQRKIYDQDDILCESVSILMNHAEILEVYQRRYQFLHVDEAQELSFVAHLLVKLLSGGMQIVLFADRDQCLGLQRSAFMDALDTFATTYTDARLAVLEGNYRNNKTIAETANSFMYKEGQGLSWANEEDCTIRYKGFAELSKLYEYGLKKVIEDESDIAFLYHDAAIAIPLVEEFMKHHVPFTFSGSVKKFLQEPLVKDICNFIELFIDARDMRAFYEVYDKMGLEISNRVLLEVSDRLAKDDNVDIYQALMESSYRVSGKKKLAASMENIRMASTLPTLKMIDFTLEKLGYRARLLKHNILMSHSSLLAIKILAQRYDDPAAFLHRLREMGEFQCEPVSRIHIRSIASAKGMEFTRVCLMDCLASTFPRPSLQEEETNEERRMFYVGMTRAKSQLEFFTSKRCFQTRLEISPFIYEVHGAGAEEEQSQQTAIATTPQPKKLKETSLRRGMRIVHATLGEGKILRISEGMMNVQFQSESKTLNIRHCISNKLIDLA